MRSVIWLVSHSVSARWRKFFSKRFFEHGFSVVRQTEIHTAETLVLDPRALEFEMLIEKLKTHKSAGTDQSTVEFIIAGSRTIRCEIQELINSVRRKEELPEEWKESIIGPIYKKGDKTDHNYCREVSRLSTRYKILSNIGCQVYLPVQRKLLGFINVNFDTTGQLLIIYYAVVKYLRKNRLKGSSASAIHKLQEGL